MYHQFNIAPLSDTCIILICTTTIQVSDPTDVRKDMRIHRLNERPRSDRKISETRILDFNYAFPMIEPFPCKKSYECRTICVTILYVSMHNKMPNRSPI